MIRVLSCSLFQSPVQVHWRNDRTEDRMSAYVRYMPVLVRAFHAIWPGWQLRIHHDDAVRRHPYFGALERMHGQGVLRLVDCGKPEALCLAMLWRLRPIWDPEVEIVISHDVDSLPLLRLRRMADEFIESDKAVMLVHACESHDGVMGGGITVRAARFRELTGCESWTEFLSMAGYVDWNGYSSDEHYQRTTLWPMVRREAMIFRNEPKPTTIPCDDVRAEPSAPPPAELLARVKEYGNAFAPYIGSAGYEIDRALDFYDSLELPVLKTIREAELAAHLRHTIFPPGI